MPLSQNEFADEDDNELFRAIKLQKWDATRQLLKTDKDNKDDKAERCLVRECDTYGNTALHAALGYKAPDDVLLQMLHLYPAAAAAHGTEDWTPLHVASMWGCSTVVLQTLILANPDALEDAGQGGIKGRTPRHFSGRFPHNKALLERPVAEWMQLQKEAREHDVVVQEEKSDKS